MKKPLISIVMTVYNNEVYFPIAIDNILNQNFKSWELIIVDDGSTDNTGKIADSYAKKDDRITVIHGENQWVYGALNSGIQKATGEYVFIHNSDDIIKPVTLEILADRINRYSPDVIWVPVIYHKCDKSQNIIEYDFINIENLIKEEKLCLSKESVEENWLWFWVKCLSDNQVNCYKTSLMTKHPFHTDMFCGDAIFNTEIADEVTSAIALSKPLYVCYRYCADSMNASFEKWNPNEHKMYNYMYKGFRELFEKWNRPKEEYVEYWNNWRINIFSMELDRLANLCKTKSKKEKIDYIFCEYIDSVIRNIAIESDRVDEINRRIVHGLKKIDKNYIYKEGRNLLFDGNEWF